MSNIYGPNINYIDVQTNTQIQYLCVKRRVYSTYKNVCFFFTQNQVKLKADYSNVLKLYI